MHTSQPDTKEERKWKSSGTKTTTTLILTPVLVSIFSQDPFRIICTLAAGNYPQKELHELRGLAEWRSRRDHNGILSQLNYVCFPWFYIHCTVHKLSITLYKDTVQWYSAHSFFTLYIHLQPLALANTAHWPFQGGSPNFAHQQASQAMGRHHMENPSHNSRRTQASSDERFCAQAPRQSCNTLRHSSLYGERSFVPNMM